MLASGMTENEILGDHPYLESWPICFLISPFLYRPRAIHIGSCYLGLPKVIRIGKCNFRTAEVENLLRRNAIRIAEFKRSDLALLILRKPP